MANKANKEAAKKVTFPPVNPLERKAWDIRAGDTVRVHQKIQEKDKTRTQVFEGLVLAHKHGTEAGATFTVRRVASGVGVEKIFPLYSPAIEKVEIVKSAKVRRAKLYHIRKKVAKEVSREMRKLRTMKDKEEVVAVEAAVPEEAAQSEAPAEAAN